MTDRRNAVGDNAVRRPASQFWAAFDALPAEVRHALNDAILPFDPVQIHAAFRSGVSARRIVWAICEQEHDEILSFAASRWPARCGAYPHLGAGATIMRSGVR